MLAVAIGGAPVAGVERVELLQCGHFAADRFRVLLATNAMPGGAAYYAGLQSGIVTIGIDMGGGAPPLLTGQIDNVTMDFALGQVMLSGRDLSARLIDTEVDETFSNRTSSQIAEGFASEAGLDANVTATTVLVGQYYELTHARTGLALHSRHATRWDLLAALAEIERFSLSVTGTILNFAPRIMPVPMVLTFGQNLLSLTIDRALALTAPRVTVKSWNPKLKQMFSSSVGTSGGVTLVQPNLTQSQADRLATARQAELAVQAVLVRGSVPGEVTMVPDSIVLLQGTSTGLDGSYRVRSVERVVDVRDGFVQHFEAVLVA